MSDSSDGQSIGTGLQQDAYLRIKAARVTQLLDLVGELGLAAAEVTQHPQLRGLELKDFEIAVHRLELLIRELQDLASSLRLVPVGTVFKRMQRLVRDLSHQTGKPLDLVLEGVDTQIDKNLVDQLHDPLMHLIRNAVDHGMESPEERSAAGKPKKGRIILTAAQQGREIHITVADDGQGLNRQAILERAREVGLVGADEEPDDSTVWSYIFHSGMSTAQEVSSLSGRGVGLDVNFDELNVTRPDLVQSVHQDYVQAGARCLETNTYGASRGRLQGYGLADRLTDINAAGVRLARAAANGQAFVAGSIGSLPSEEFTDDPVVWSADEVYEIFKEQAVIQDH